MTGILLSIGLNIPEICILLVSWDDGKPSLPKMRPFLVIQ
jgi:hypothetical protein